MNIHFINLPDCLRRPLDEIAPLLSYTISEEGTPVTVRQNEVGPKIIVDGDAVTIEYHKIPEFCRILTMLPQHIGTDGMYEEHPAHEDLCLMSDCSRNAVFHLDAAKRMIRYIALMGFTAFMLYTEDTYEIPEYPMFGHMRGRFTQEELKAIDDYAALFGIEVIPCIQVLAHLATALQWGDFNSVKEDANTLLVGSENTYTLIDAMLHACRTCFRTKRIHIGMDEAHGLGRGRYLDLHGERPRSDIFLEHLNKVVEMCAQYDFSPMIWSDMFFRNAFGGGYYVKEGEIPPAVIEMVPKNVSLVYWDYYNPDEQTVRHMMHCHKQFDNPVLFAGGAWKWDGMTPKNYFSLYANDTQLRIAREERLPMVIATTWGDNGAEASNFSVMPTLQQYAEYCYARGEDRNWVAARFEQTFHMAFDDCLLVDSPNLLSDTNRRSYNSLIAKQLLYNDVLGGLVDHHIKPCYAQEYADKADALSRVPEGQFSYILRTTEALCRLLALKATLSVDIRAAYGDKDTAALKEIADNRIPATIEAVTAYLAAARREWYHDNKPFGFEVVEMRLGGLKERLSSAKQTIEEYVSGYRDRIEQLDEPLGDHLPGYGGWYPHMFTVSVV